MKWLKVDVKEISEMTEYRLYLVRCCTKVYTICQQSLNCIPHEDSASTIKNTNNLLHNLVVISWENRINELNKEHPNWRTERKINENKRVGETQPEDQTNFRFLKQEEKDNGIGKKKKRIIHGLKNVIEFHEIISKKTTHLLMAICQLLINQI